MPANEIKELRKAGKLDEAYSMAKTELDGVRSSFTFPDGLTEEAKQKIISADYRTLWAKRNLSWVIFEYLKANCSAEKIEAFKTYLNELVALQLPEEEKMLFDQVAWQIGKLIFSMENFQPKSPGFSILSFVDNQNNIQSIFELVRNSSFTKPSEAYSFLFKAFHKAFKPLSKYIEFADWWGFENFRNEDFEKEKLTNGKEVMSLVEQAYITYAKHLLPASKTTENHSLDVDKIKLFIPKLENIIRDHPEYQYPPFFMAKLLLALGDKDNMLVALLPFARKKMNDFWVWEVLSEAVVDEELVLSCYCRALLCKTPEEFLVGIRQKMAELLIARKLFAEAKNEIDMLVATRIEHKYKMPVEVTNWMKQDWYRKDQEKNILKGSELVKQLMAGLDKPKPSNVAFYKKHQGLAEALLFSDYPEEEIAVDFVNTDKKILNFVTTDGWSGFFKYDRFDINVHVGDLLKVRFKEKKAEGPQQVYSVALASTLSATPSLLKEVSGEVKIPTGKNFGFIQDIFIHPSTVKAMNITNGLTIKGKAVRTYNSEKKQWGWKLFKIER